MSLPLHHPLPPKRIREKWIDLRRGWWEGIDLALNQPALPPALSSPSPISSSNLNRAFWEANLCCKSKRKQQQQIWDHHQAACGWPPVGAEGPKNLRLFLSQTLPSSQQRPGQLLVSESLRGITRRASWLSILLFLLAASSEKKRRTLPWL